MTYDEFLRQLGKAGLTVRGFAKLVRMNRVSISNNAKKGHVPSHLAVIACLMGEMADKGIDYQEVLSKIDIQARKPRGAAAKGKFGGDRQEDMFPKRPGAPASNSGQK
jgi:hypothetical protein